MSNCFRRIFKTRIVGQAAFLKLVMLVVASGLCAEPEGDKPTLTFGYIEFPPFYYTDTEGKAVGPLVDMAEAIGEEVGFDLIHVSLPPKRAVLLVGQGDVDLWFGLASNESYNDQVYISKDPLDQLELRAYSLKGMDLFDDVKSLNGKSVVIERGYSYGGLVHYVNDPKNNIDVVRVGDIFQAFKVLEVRDLDYFLSYTRPANRALVKSPVKNLSSRILSSLKVHITLHKDIDGAAELMEKIEKAQRKLFPTVESIYGVGEAPK